MTLDKKDQTAHGVLAIFVVLIVLALLLRLWVLLAPLLLGLFVYGLWLLLHKSSQTTAQLSSSSNAPNPQPVPVSEQELVTLAFGLLQRRITEQVIAVHPHAKWVWSEQGARERFAAGGPLTIQLNGAGGYQKASVQVSDLQFHAMLYLTQSGVPVQPEEIPKPPEEVPPQDTVDYGLLAFEWTEANLQRIYALNNEAVSNGEVKFHIPADELPHGNSWPEVCKELRRNGFAIAEPVADGIQIQIKPQGEENEQA